jgi:signal transduction histidine kinase
VKSLANRLTMGLQQADAAHPMRTDAVLAFSLYLLATFAVTTGGELSRPDGELVGAAANIAIVGPLVWRRRAPAAVLCLIVVTSGLGIALLGGTGGEVAALVALATFAADEPNHTRLAPAAIGSAAVVVAAILLDDPGGTLAVLTAAVAGMAAAFSVGLAIRARRAQLDATADRAERLRREREQQTELAVAAERERLAREVHDVVAHNISVMIALADGAVAVAIRSPAEAREAVGQIAGTGRDALMELQGLLDVLGRSEDRAGELLPQPGLGDLDDLLQRLRGVGLEARLCIEGDPVAIGKVAEMTIYRIVQEALTNVLRHARGATRAEIKLRFCAGELRLEVIDNGETADSHRAEGRGLSGMRDRASVLGAALQAGPGVEFGWRIAATIPLGDRGGSGA